MKSVIAPFETKRLGTLLLIPGGPLKHRQRSLRLQIQLLKSQRVRRVRQPPTPPQSEPRPATGHLQILFSNTGFSASLVKYLFFSY